MLHGSGLPPSSWLSDIPLYRWTPGLVPLPVCCGHHAQDLPKCLRSARHDLGHRGQDSGLLSKSRGLHGPAVCVGQGAGLGEVGPCQLWGGNCGWAPYLFPGWPSGLLLLFVTTVQELALGRFVSCFPVLRQGLVM